MKLLILQKKTQDTYQLEDESRSYNVIEKVHFQNHKAMSHHRTITSVHFTNYLCRVLNLSIGCGVSNLEIHEKKLKKIFIFYRSSHSSTG